MHYPMIARLLKVLNLSIMAKLGGVIGTWEDDKKLNDELSDLIMNFAIVNKDLDYLLEKHPEIQESYREYKHNEKANEHQK